MTDSRTLNVLIVEEDARTRDLLRVGLDSFSSFTVESIEPEWASEIARDRAFDLVLVNLEMKDGSDGLEVVQAIREVNPRPEFILLTRGRSSRSSASIRGNSWRIGLGTHICRYAFFIASLPIGRRQISSTVRPSLAGRLKGNVR